jgi:hypothetical protein
MRAHLLSAEWSRSGWKTTYTLVYIFNGYKELMKILRERQSCELL